ncbi:apidaecins type 73-like [Penaeus vannamei]|uniref:apidaecins type 73-like n=1 Tax=Penaeus vannamei TaxID=6689 RepID=UPI00387F3AFE
MKYLAFVLLAAAVCASQVEKREAEPSQGYPSTVPSYAGYTTHQIYKRSAAPEADAEPSRRRAHGRHFSVPATYAHSVRGFHKRSADPEADAEPSVAYSSAAYSPAAPVYSPYSGHGYHKRSAEADASHGLSHGTYILTPATYRGHSHHGLHRRSAEPEAEASTGYYSAPPVYVPVASYGHNVYRRSAEAEAEPSTPYAPVHHTPAPLYRPRYF